MFDVDVFFKLIASALSILIGFLAGRISKISRQEVSNLVFYYISPIVFCSTPILNGFSLSTLMMPLTMFCIATLMCLICYFFLGRLFFSDFRLNITAISAGDSNCSYFLLPVVISTFDSKVVGMFMIGVIGLGIYESSVGFYICAMNNQTSKQAIIRVLRLPTLSAFTLGILASSVGVKLPSCLVDFIYNMRSAFTLIGMMVIGLSMASIKNFKFDFKFILFSIVTKFILHPLVILSYIYIDRNFIHSVSNEAYTALFLMSLGPMSANILIISSILNLDTEKVGTAVLVSTTIALFYVPFAIKFVL